MVTIISASNRDDNLTALFSKRCKAMYDEKKIVNQLFFLNEIPNEISLRSVYDYKNSIFKSIGEELISPAEKILFVVPEYNGSIPGILKLFIDAIEPKVFYGKKAALIGVAAGRAGNLRGLDHLTDILHHLEVNVMPQKLPISKMYDLLQGGEVVDQTTVSAIEKQVELFLKF